MTQAPPARTWVRTVNGFLALALVAFVFGAYWPIVKTFDLHLADLGAEGQWIGDHARLITTVTPGGAADRAGLGPGDVLEFDPARGDDWILAGYRHMPAGFVASLPVRRADGSQGTVSLAPARFQYLPTSNDRVALAARMTAITLCLLIWVFIVWSRPCLMTWSLLLATLSGCPARFLADYYLAFEAGPGLHALGVLPAATLSLVVAFVPLAASFPRDKADDWPRWSRIAAAVGIVAWIAYLTTAMYVAPFERDPFARTPFMAWSAMCVLAPLAGVWALVRRYHRSGEADRARLRWALFGMSFTMIGFAAIVSMVFAPVNLAAGRRIASLTPGNWAAVASWIVFAASILYAVVRQRVVDIQFAVSRTVVYGVVTTAVLVFIAVLHWLLGRMIEHSRLAFGLEGLAAVGLGLVLHRASHRINTTVDRVLFRRHHAAEERLRQVTAVLPFATTEESIAAAIVAEPARNLELASAALFYRASTEGPLQRVRSVGWEETHASRLDPESLLVRYLQAEHAAVRLEDEQQWLPPGVPAGVAHPVLAIPIVTQHTLNAVVLYGSHVDGTLPDPDEVVLLEALAKAAATSHQQVRVAMLMRERESQQQQIDRQQERISHLEETAAELRELLQGRLSGSPGASSQEGSRTGR